MKGATPNVMISHMLSNSAPNLLVAFKRRAIGPSKVSAKNPSKIKRIARKYSPLKEKKIEKRPPIPFNNVTDEGIM